MTLKKSKLAAADNTGGNTEDALSASQPDADTSGESKADDNKSSRRPRRMAREPKAGAASMDVPAIEEVTPQPKTSTPAEPRQTKSAAVLALLQRKEGATLDQLVEATGWLPHTARAALTGFKKKGHAITSSKEEGKPRVYRAGQA